VYWIKTATTIEVVPPCILNPPNYVSYLLYIAGMLLLTYISLVAAKYLDSDSIESASVIGIESANNAFLPSYLGYFFVALDVPNNETLNFVYAMLFAFTFFSQTLYFNPVFLLFGYQFYNLTNVNQVKIFMITRKKFKDPKQVIFPKLHRINHFTFIDNEK
jgi:hypothetical protein